jgi:hypothetical protein
MLFNKDWEKPKINPVADVLLRGADLMETHGHIKHVRKTVDGMCFLGALQMAQGIDDSKTFIAQDSALTHRAAKVFAEMLRLPLIYGNVDDRRGDAATWNNSEKVTGKDVIAAMRKAAKVAAKLKEEEYAV